MYSLTERKTIEYLSRKYGFRTKKSLGQNFLINDDVLKEIASAAADEAILEIGPGIGALTAALAVNAKKVVSVELDRELLPVLNETLSGFDNIEIINSDFMKLNLHTLFEEKFSGLGVSVAANLPYYITTPIILKLLEARLNLNKIVIMVQKEVADRILASPGNRDYGALTVSVNFYCTPFVVAQVGRENFVPSPAVDSTVLGLSVSKEPRVHVKDERLFFALVRAAFSQRRKTLANALKNSGLFGGREEILAAFSSLGLGEMERGENLSISEFAALSNIFSENKNKHLQ